jgi:hypothetical protein
MYVTSYILSPYTLHPRPPRMSMKIVSCLVPYVYEDCIMQSPRHVLGSTTM